MRHRVYGKHLSRDKNERTALFKSLVQNLILSESIQTTQAKAKAIQPLVDKLITQAKSPNTRRLVSQILNTIPAEKLIKEITPRLKTRNSGFTSITKLGKRLGDGAMLVSIRLLLEEEKKAAPVKAEKDVKVAEEKPKKVEAKKETK